MDNLLIPGLAFVVVSEMPPRWPDMSIGSVVPEIVPSENRAIAQKFARSIAVALGETK